MSAHVVQGDAVEGGAVHYDARAASDSLPPVASNDRKRLWWTAALLFAIWLVLYEETIGTMVSIWWQSTTFNHCFLILPLAAYVGYSRRSSLREITLAPFFPGLFALLALTCVWLAGWSAGAGVVQQFAVVGMIPVCALCVFGVQFARQFAGPLLYLLFAVPFGEIFIYPMQEFTASSIMAGLNLTGIGVVRNGLLLSTSVGDFEVERACSGIRYLIASLALSWLFALLYLTTTRRRVLFILISLVTPVLANGVRAFLIVILAHVSNLNIATGVDHLIYGWFFFGIVMLLVFSLGMRLSRRESQEASNSTKREITSMVSASTMRRVAAMVVVIVVMGSAPLTAKVIQNREMNLVFAPVKMPDLSSTWSPPAPTNQDWIPAFPGRLGIASARYEQHDRGPAVDVAIAWYGTVDTSGRIIGYGSRNVDKTRWRERTRGETSLTTTSGQRVAFMTSTYDSLDGRRHRVNWYSYLIGSTPIADDYMGKVLEGWTRISSPGRATWSIALSAEVDSIDSGQPAVLVAFAEQNFMTLIEPAHQRAEGPSADVMAP